jgi:hypothetical protein
LHFRTRAGFRPEIQSCTDLFRALADPGQPPVSGAPTLLQNSRVNAFSIVADAQTQQPITVPNFGFDPVCSRVLESIPQRLVDNPVHFVL